MLSHTVDSCPSGHHLGLKDGGHPRVSGSQSYRVQEPGWFGFLSRVPLTLSSPPPSPQRPQPGLHQSCRECSPRGSPQGGFNLPSGRALGRLALSQACLAYSSGRNGPVTALRVRLEGLSSADKSPKRGVGRGRDRRKSPKAGASEWKAWKGCQGAWRSAGLEGGAGSARPGADLLLPPCSGVGAAGHEGPRPRTGQDVAPGRRAQVLEVPGKARRATFSPLNAPFPPLPAAAAQPAWREEVVWLHLGGRGGVQTT